MFKIFLGKMPIVFVFISEIVFIGNAVMKVEIKNYLVHTS